MMFVDRRRGSAELYLPLCQSGVPDLELTELPYGDFAWTGRGPQDSDQLIGIERKTIPDLLNSMTSGRLSGHQLPGLVDLYAHTYLLIEGRYRISRDGWLEMPSGRSQSWSPINLKPAAVENYLMTLTMRGGVHVVRTWDTEGSVAWLAAAYHWWTGKAWEEHRAHLSLHLPVADHTLWTRPNMVHTMAACLPGVDRKAVDVARKFPTVLDMCAADEATWREIPGIGKIRAAQIVRVLQTTDNRK